MERIILNLEKKSYPIVIGQELSSDSLFFCSLSKNDRVLCVTDDCVASFHFDML